MRLHMLRTSWLLAAVFLVFTSCEHAGPFEVDADEPTLDAVQQSVFNSSCAVSGCHLGSAAPLGLDLSEGEAEDNLVDVDSRQNPTFKRVAPGNPDDSYLVMKIEGDSRITGQRMPAGGRPALSNDQIQLVRDWISALAP